MKKEDLVHIEEVLKHSSIFKCGQVGYEMSEDVVLVWSIKYRDSLFYATELIPLFTYPFFTYIRYESDREKCVMVIF